MNIETNKCFECNSTFLVEEHHIVPKILGGTKTIPLCINCHGLVHNRDFVKSRTLQKIGIEKAKKEGKYKNNGRYNKIETIEDFMKKQKVKKICVLRCTTNLSFRDIALSVPCSLGLVQKVYNLIPEHIAFSISKEQTMDIKLLCDKELKIKRLENKLEKLKLNNL